MPISRSSPQTSQAGVVAYDKRNGDLKCGEDHRRELVPEREDLTRFLLTGFSMPLAADRILFLASLPIDDVELSAEFSTGTARDQP